MSRLDLLKKTSSTSQKKTSTKSSPRGGMLGQKSQQNSDDLADDLLLEDDFENDLIETTADTYDTDDDISDDIDIDDEHVNIIEIDLGETKGLDIDSSLINEENENNETVDDYINSGESVIEEDDDSSTEIVEGQISVNYSEDDIKFEKEYSFDHREQLYNHFVKLIKNGSLEISSSKLLHLDDIVRISVTLSELKEQVGCEGRIISVFPPSISLNNENTERYRYIVQFIGPNASETERVLSKYLLGYKAK
ncbi:PilZ domain-containing protein [Francisella noatunensis]|uniref:PilZ domain-containing protein n=1 Tax=Francisella noatunensis TaxID=657445 RepID=A0A9Q2KVA0_9GAMM|nr:PilZ domain-containing protein [Francisella noatunensis]MBK2028616.1 PilZ domain-containing protein [Francisella noatunensis]MBK2034386.1 PilZ domain-containing protein [Francisella noatunensis]MBK2048286.1 PilZ domain-containing protein [Francisella noatunensis]MBK2050732.1 PilZ domain-containing protein [Francisella noatunensis]MBK2051159.1 PilZ domain-containing protein [Francisella noatunensis]